MVTRFPIQWLGVFLTLTFVISGCGGAPGASTGPATGQPADAYRASDPTAFKLAAGKPQLVEFFAFWCTTCAAMRPIVHNLEAEYGQKISFVYLDIDDPKVQPWMQKLNYVGRPHFYLLDGQGNILKAWIGAVPKDDLVAGLSAALKNPN
jgi:thiol-disulfide isomerase/thioredoxin